MFSGLRRDTGGDYLIQFVLLLPIAMILVLLAVQIMATMGAQETMQRAAWAGASELQRQAILGEPGAWWDERLVLAAVEANLASSPWTWVRPVEWTCAPRGDVVGVCVEPQTRVCGVPLSVRLVWPEWEMGVDPGSIKLELGARAVLPSSCFW